MSKNIEKFIEYISKEKGYSLLTQKAYQGDLCDFESFCTQMQFVLEDVTYDIVRAWIVRLSQKGYNNRSINRKVTSLRSFYKWMQHLGLITINPLQLHRSLKVEKKLHLPFSREEVAKVRSLIEQNKDFSAFRDLLVVDLLYTLGIRRAELIALEMKDLNLDTKQVKVLGKGGKSRYVPMLPSLEKTLKSYIEHRQSLLGCNKVEGPLLLQDNGNKINEMFVYRLINSYFSVVTTKEKKSPHVLRHSFASHLIEAGADINSVKELLGHESLSTTQIYTRVNLQELKNVYQSAHPRGDKKK